MGRTYPPTPLPIRPRPSLSAHAPLDFPRKLEGRYIFQFFPVETWMVPLISDVSHGFCALDFHVKSNAKLPLPVSTSRR
jgi:hypothetical protein